MSVEQAQVIDAIGINDSNGHLELLIDDKLDWSNEGEHLDLLQKKLDMYLHFVLEGQIWQHFNEPDDLKRNVCFVVRFEHDLTNNATEFLDFFKISLIQHKIMLGWVVEKKS